MRKLAKLLVGAVLTVALVGSVAAFAACGDDTTDTNDPVIDNPVDPDNPDNPDNPDPEGELTISYQFQAYCKGHSSWLLLSLYSDSSIEGWSRSTAQMDLGYATEPTTTIFYGSWEEEIDEDNMGRITVVYTSAVVDGVSYDGFSYSSISNYYDFDDPDDAYSFGTLLQPLYGGGQFNSACTGAGTLTDQIYTDPEEWYLTVKDTTPEDDETGDVIAEFTGLNGENTVTLSLYSDGTGSCDNGLGYGSDLTWDYSDGTFTVLLNGETELEATISEESATISYVNSTFGITTAITLTCSDSDQIAAIMAGVSTVTSVAEFTGLNGENTVTLTLYSDNTGKCDNGLGYDSDLTWEYTSGSLTVMLNGTTELTTSIDGNTATILYENSTFGITTAITLTCSDISGITG